MPLRSVFGDSSGSASEQILSVLRAVRRHLAMGVGFISEFVAGDRVFRVSDAGTTHNPVAVGTRAPLEQSFCHYVAKGLMPGLMRYGRRIGCEIVAEGVETAAEYVLLKGLGVTRVQGFLTGRPTPLDAAAALPLSATEGWERSPAE